MLLSSFGNVFIQCTISITNSGSKCLYHKGISRSNMKYRQSHEEHESQCVNSRCSWLSSRLASFLFCLLALYSLYCLSNQNILCEIVKIIVYRIINIYTHLLHWQRLACPAKIQAKVNRTESHHHHQQIYHMTN